MLSCSSPLIWPGLSTARCWRSTAGNKLSAWLKSLVVESSTARDCFRIRYRPFSVLQRLQPPLQPLDPGGINGIVLRHAFLLDVRAAPATPTGVAAPVWSRVLPYVDRPWESCLGIRRGNASFQRR